MPSVLKGVYREGSMIASVIQEEASARIMLKGAEPGVPRDPAFLAQLKQCVQGCWQHIEKFEKRELHAVFVQRPAQAEHVDLSTDDLKGMGLQRVAVMDGDCGIVIRSCDVDPPATSLAYGSLRAGAGGVLVQPGRVDIPPALIRRTHKDLTPPQKQVYEAAVQMAGQALMKCVCLEDEGLKMAITVKDLPPARARSVLFPLGAYADDVAKGAPLEEIAKRLNVVRAG